MFKSGTLGDHRKVGVLHAKSALGKGLHYAPQQDAAINSSVLGVVVGEMSTDVPEPGCAQQRIAEGVNKHVTV